MKLATFLLFFALPVAAFDALYYHIWKFRLFQQPSCRGEMVTHLSREVVFFFTLLTVVTVRPHGAWYWAFAGLVLADQVINMTDVFFESTSRIPLGGLPRLEYMLHVFGASVAGAAQATYLYSAWPLRLEPTALVPHPPGYLPSFVVMWGYGLLVGTVATFLLEGTLFARSLLRESAASPVAPPVP
jgi:hypothetical protein